MGQLRLGELLAAALLAAPGHTDDVLESSWVVYLAPLRACA